MIARGPLPGDSVVPYAPPRTGNGADRHDAASVAARLQPIPAVRIRNAAEVAAQLPKSTWQLRPYVETNAVILLYGDYGTFKSFIVIDWAMRMALGLPAIGNNWPAKQCDVLLISAEGRGLPHRLRGWCMKNFPDESFHDVLQRASLYCIEHPVCLSDPSSALALVAAIDALCIEPGCVIVDTMTRNSDGKIENSTTDAGAYLAIIDQGLRARYRCAVILTHHVGHADKTRMRGPIVLAANTDALIQVERPDALQRQALLTVTRLKDSELPSAQPLLASIVDLGELDEDQQPITTLAMELSDAPTTATTPATTALRGKAQRQLLAALKAQSDGPGIWTIADLREVGRLAGLHKNTARSAAEALTFTSHVISTIGGWKLADV